jgi:glycosyltransferase involved in cell wall biosynthesis
MKAVLILFEKLSNRHRRGLGRTSLQLAERLLAEDCLEQVICLELDPDADVFEGRAHVFWDHKGFHLAYYVLSQLGRFFPGLKTRRLQELLFDWFAKSRIHCRPDTMLFVSRPLFNGTVAKAKAAGMKIWIQSSVAHPFLNYVLAKNEELRLGLPGKNAYSDLARAKKIASVILNADRLITLAPEIGKFTYDSYVDFIDPQHVLPLKDYFSIDPGEFASIAAGRRAKGPDDEIVFFHLSFLNLIKGIPYLLDAWRRLQESGVKNCRLVLGGKMDHNIQQLIRERYADLENVEYAGYVPELASLLDRVDVFISPSISDAGPATILEAMSAGLPVISSRNCGFASVLTEDLDGFTYPFNDVSRLTELLKWFSENPERILPMGQAARGKVANLSTGMYTDEIFGHIKKIDHEN